MTPLPLPRCNVLLTVTVSIKLTALQPLWPLFCFPRVLWGWGDLGPSAFLPWAPVTLRVGTVGRAGLVGDMTPAEMSLLIEPGLTS